MFIKHSLLSGRHPDFRCQPFAYEDSDCFFNVPGFATIAVGKKKYIYFQHYIYSSFSLLLMVPLPKIAHCHSPDGKKSKNLSSLSTIHRYSLWQQNNLQRKQKEILQKAWQ